MKWQFLNGKARSELVLQTLAILLVMLTVAGLATLALFAFSPTFETSQLEDEVIINGSKAMVPNTEIYYTYQGKPALLIRIETNDTLERGLDASDGTWWISFSAECTHENARIEFVLNADDPSESTFYCPAHDGVFEVSTGDVIAGPPPGPLKGIILEDRGSELWAVGYDKPAEHIPSIPLFLIILAIPVIPVLYHLLKEILSMRKPEPEETP